MTEILENTAVPGSSGSWNEATGRKFHIAISKDEDGRYSVIALNLPGVGSSGDTPEEAMTGFEEAARGAVASYEAAGDPIPWKLTNSKDIPAGADHKWIILHV